MLIIYTGGGRRRGNHKMRYILISKSTIIYDNTILNNFFNIENDIWSQLIGCKSIIQIDII